jgi:WD40 repeat protein
MHAYVQITDLGARTPTASMPPVVAVKVMHRWNVVVFATANKLIHAWDIAGGKMITTIKFDCISLDYNDTLDFMLTGGTDGFLGLWKFIPGTQPSPLVQVSKWKVHERHVLAVPYVSSVDALIACGSDGFLRLIPHFQEKMVPREYRTGNAGAPAPGSGGRAQTKLTE